MQSVFLRLLPLLLAAVVGAVLFAAWNRPDEKPMVTAAGGVPVHKHSEKFMLAPDASLPVAPERLTVPTNSSLPRDTITLPAPAAGIIRKYKAAADISERLDLLHDLADDEQTGRAALIELFRDEKDEALKTTMLNLADTVGEPTQDLYTLLDMGMQPSQPPDVRDAAQRILLLNPGPGAIPVWQHLLGDADPDMRDLAAQQIAQLQGQQ